MSHRHMLAALACAGILSGTGAVQAAQAAPPAHVQKAKAERKAAKALKRVCATQDLSSAFENNGYPYNSPVPVRCTDGYPADLDVTPSDTTVVAAFEISTAIEHEGPLFLYYDETPVAWTYGPDFTWYEDNYSLLKDAGTGQHRMAFHDVHGTLVAWRTITVMQP